jgi:threonine synthase
MNSVNPFRIEGQKTIMYRVLEGLGWEVPDWVIVPGGNLGNTSAFGKAFVELRELGLVKRSPRLAVINASGANTLYELHEREKIRFDDGRWDRVRVEAWYVRMSAEGRRAKTVASAIEIGRPVNLSKALRSLDAMNGVVRQVGDEDILDGKALVGAYGYGCEPASGASVAGLRLLLEERVISPSDRVVCILTGHQLKDPDVTVNYHRGSRDGTEAGSYANPPVRCAADIEAIAKLLDA